MIKVSETVLFLLRMFAVDNRSYYALRLAAAMCFIGHGAFGLITKQIWCNYFAVAGVGHDMAYQLMPVLGTVDILMGLSLLFYPTRAVVLWLVIWALVTALLRPLSGEPFAETIERAGNYGAPLALLVLCSASEKNKQGYFSLLKSNNSMDTAVLRKVTICLKTVIFLLLVGHGWLNITEKRAIMGQYSSLGFSNPALTAHVVGVLEIAAGFMVLLRPIRPLIFALLIWKMGTELFYPHWELFEWIERAGSYGALLAFWYIIPETPWYHRKSFSMPGYALKDNNT